MAQIQNRPDLIAARYDGLPGGPRLAYSFETQPGLPVDNTNPLLRALSPFTLRIVPPSIIGAQEELGVNVNLIGRANQSLQDTQAAANAVRSLFGVQSITGSEQASARLIQLERLVSAGQVISGATSDTERAVLVDSSTAASIAYQVERVLQTPPLTLLINPSEMSISYTSIQQFSERSREGYIFQRWGEAQPTASFSGSTGGFVAGVNPQAGFPEMQETPSVSGLQYASKHDSAAWQNFMSLFQFYKNNGYIYDLVGGTEAHLLIGAIAIDYDQFTYVGHIESFDFSYQENMPHRVEWSMEFTIDQMFDTAQAPLSVQPMIAPQPNPSYPSRTAQRFTGRPDALSGTSGPARTSGEVAVAQTPLALLGTFGTGG